MTAQEFAASLEALIGTARDGRRSSCFVKPPPPCKVCWTLRAGSIQWFYAGGMSGRQETVAITRPSTSPPTPCC
jgi:hypothetical protein